MKEKMEFQFYEEEPNLTVTAQLKVLALAPLSMVSSQPGSYYRSELKPTSDMLYGLCENALGWHFHDSLRKEMLKALTKRVKKSHKKNDAVKEHPWFTGKASSSGSNFISLLQHHVKFGKGNIPDDLLSYDDLWSMANRASSINFIGGSRNYDSRLEDVINLSRLNKIVFGDRKEFQSFTLDELRNLKEGKVKVTSMSPYYPMYYNSPRKRGYVETSEGYKFNVECTPTVAGLLKNAFNNPKAPLYLGNSEGWVHVNWIEND